MVWEGFPFPISASMCTFGGATNYEVYSQQYKVKSTMHFWIEIEWHLEFKCVHYCWNILLGLAVANGYGLQSDLLRNIPSLKLIACPWKKKVVSQPPTFMGKLLVSNLVVIAAAKKTHEFPADSRKCCFSRENDYKVGPYKFYQSFLTLWVAL